MKDENIIKEWEHFIKKYKKYFLSNEENWINILENIRKYYKIYR